MKLWFLAAVVVLLILMFAWFYFTSKLFALMRREYPELYAALDSPNVIMRNGTRQQVLLMKYLFQRQWRTISDEHLNFYSYSLLGVYVCYVLLIFGVVGFVLLRVG